MKKTRCRRGSELFTSWQHLGDLGYEGVRMIAIDEDWSALCLRHVDYIKSMVRDSKRAMSAEGKRRLRR